ncbi:C4b-binding protein alpha chain-like isoform X3 [Ambystoma mexicanum]|uniref:C4b-binding protein alpha chain-like isoform X3 n=1 Tax=Ambystoma mexicanum TaxID=8296 RepID=UPI0037E78D60
MGASRSGGRERGRTVVLARLVWLAACIAAVYGDCGRPKELSNASIKDERPDATYAVGDRVTYVCNESQGYVPSPGKPDTITCTEDSSWSDIQEFCELSCKLPTKFDFGDLDDKFINQNVFPVGSSVTYRCRPGYTPIPGKTRKITCLDTLEWSQIPEFCERKDCRSPGEPLNGGVNLEETADGDLDTKFGAVATFFCNTGYRIVGRKKRTCTADGWNGAVPQCEDVICSKPPDIENGMHNQMGQEEFRYQAAVTYSCSSKTFSLLGNASIYCTESGDWSSSAPTCKEIRCKSPDVANAQRTTGFGVNHGYRDAITFECTGGFQLNGYSTIECGEDNQWHPSLPTCVPVTCGDPPEVVDGKHSSTGTYKPGDYVVYSCNSGFAFSGSDSVRCESDGSWSGPTPTCSKVVTCGNPPDLVDGTHTGRSPYQQRDSVTYRCNSGYTLSGPPSINCQIDGTWSGPTPTCRRVVTCGNPPGLVNGSHSSRGPYTYGSSVTYRCNSGFTLSGPPSIHCKIDGSWSGPTPMCIRAAVIICEIPLLKNGKITTSVSTLGHKDTIDIECDSFYSLEGESRITCGEDKAWYPSEPKCHLSIGAVVGCFIGSVGALGLAGFAIWYFFLKNRGK